MKMSRGLVLLFLSVNLIVSFEPVCLQSMDSNLTAGIIKHPPAVVYVTANENIAFECDTKGTKNEQWTIDNVTVRDRPHTQPGVNSTSSNIIMMDDNSTVKHHVLYISVNIFLRNNSIIECRTQDKSNSNVYYKSTSSLIIVGPPLPPDLKMDVSQNGSLLTLSWDEPFTFIGFNVTRYVLWVTSRSQMNTVLYENVVDIGLNHSYSLHTLKHGANNECHELVFVVYAFSKVGTSRGEIIGGFPIAPGPVTINTNILFMTNGAPHLEVWFTPGVSCSYQEDNYTVIVSSEEGKIIQPLSYNMSTEHLQYESTQGVHRYSFESDLLKKGTQVTVIVISSSVVGVKKITQDIPIAYSDCDTYRAVLGILATTCLVFFVLLIIFICLYCKKTKVLNKQIKTQTFSGQLTRQVQQKPTSITLSKGASNPIYDGPLYESPTGEPLRALLSSAPSTPSTPTPTVNSPRYFEMSPPSLPPPRKSSVSSLAPCVIQDTSHNGGCNDTDRIKKSVFDFSPVEDEYTIMRSAHSVKSKPSPLSIPGLARTSFDTSS